MAFWISALDAKPADEDKQLLWLSNFGFSLTYKYGESKIFVANVELTFIEKIWMENLFNEFFSHVFSNPFMSLNFEVVSQTHHLAFPLLE